MAKKTLEKKHIVLLTGAAGYVGAMLAKAWAAREDVALVIGLDYEPRPDLLEGNEKVLWVRKNTSDESWMDVVRPHAPDIVVHAAWQIRALYGKGKTQWKWNVEGSHAVFRFAVDTESVSRLVHFGTASTYSARKDNEIDRLFTEEDPMREDDYLYALEKKAAEEMLHAELERAAALGKSLEAAVVRPAAITGPRGRFMRNRFGLQSALSGKLKGGPVYALVTLLTKVVPGTKKWCRQFVHEDDVVDIVTALAFNPLPKPFSIYNMAPPGAVVTAKDMAQAVGKKVILIPPQLIAVAFFVLYHATFGKIPTSRGGWRFYSYPIVMDGSKVTRELGIAYRMGSLDAFRTTAGTYEYAVPLGERVSS